MRSRAWHGHFFARYLNGLPDGSVLAPHFNPFNVWKEAALTGKHLNFLTGYGFICNDADELVFTEVTFASEYKFANL